LSEKAPPIRGPSTAAIPYVAPVNPINAGRFCGSAINPIMVNAPDPIPAPPKPAIARPKMKAVGFGATPHIKLPSSKSAMATMKYIFSEKYL
jgi:hypothetical protein